MARSASIYYRDVPVEYCSFAGWRGWRNGGLAFVWHVVNKEANVVATAQTLVCQSILLAAVAWLAGWSLTICAACCTHELTAARYGNNVRFRQPVFPLPFQSSCCRFWPGRTWLLLLLLRLLAPTPIERHLAYCWCLFAA